MCLGLHPVVDVKYILKQCLDAGLVEEGVYLLTLLEQYQQAVELALTINLGTIGGGEPA